jgi:hypothetical protein
VYANQSVSLCLFQDIPGGKNVLLSEKNPGTMYKRHQIVINELEIGAVGTNFSWRTSWWAREDPAKARTCKSMNTEHVFEMYTIASDQNPPAPSCQGPPGCGASFIPSIILILLSHISIAPQSESPVAKSPPYPPEPKKHCQMPPAPELPYFLSPQDPSIRIKKPTLHGP